jgi:glyoxylate carboligase
MPKMNVMDAVVRVMESEGVDVVFGVPGAAILPLYKALAQSSIKHVSVRHEEGGTHAADGYARVTGKVGVNIGTSGPAGTNMITGLYTAMADSIPMICITGQAPTDVLQFQTTYRPRHYICCGQAGPLGWEVPACIGAKLGAPEKLIVGIVGDYSFQFLMEEVAVAVQYRVPFVLVMLNDTYMGLIRQAEKYGYDENYAVDLSFDNGDTVGIDHVAVMEAMGAMGRRVTEPGDIADTLRWAVDASEEHRLPVLVEIMTECDTDAAMGVAIDAINEYEPILDGAFERSGAVVGALPEGD